MKLNIRIILILTLAILSISACRRKKLQPEKTETAPTTQPATNNVVEEEFPEITPYYPEQKTKVYEMVEQMPQFPGGESKLLKYITSNIKYPVIAQKKHIQGTVIIRFVVTSTGDIKQYEVLRSLDAACDREALRIVASLPRWIPGKQNGTNVDVYYTLPIRFKLK
jgi:protein TonB